MSERKSVNKHVEITKIFQKKWRFGIEKKKTIRFMIPFDIYCLTCYRIIYQGKKINAIKEKVLFIKYLGIQLFRFYFKCTHCMKGITIKTDPKGSSYFAEINCKPA